MTANLPVRSELVGESPYGAPQLSVPVLLNVNENPYAPAPEVVEGIAQQVVQAAVQLNRYPDRDFEQLRSDLADYLAEESGVQLPPEQIWAANGSNEVMLQLLQAFGGPGRVAVSFAPTYSMYPEYARDAFTRYVAGARKPDFSLDFDEIRRVLTEERPAILLLASPNNPTGTAVPLQELREVLELTVESGPVVRAPAEAVASAHVADRAESDVGAQTAQPSFTANDPSGNDHGAGATPSNTPAGSEAKLSIELPSSTIVVVDEAYGEFRRAGVPSALELLEEFPHLVVSRTMSKAFGAAGLRLGYMAASRAIIEQVMLVRLPYHLSALTQAAAHAALAHRSSLMAQVAQLRVDRDQLARDIAELGFTVAPSDANFVFFGVLKDRHAVWQGLLDRGVLIREVGPDGWLRVSVGTPEENRAFMAALREVVP
ncbi:MAG: aminotransferase class I/II-fold pyridoxal phosphate-dependent enzyme [Arcanobacterium sp.]|nr:aminotransferase class I/II-fold pyridoxal phosphate-dependent enzyme [Arcanobacterium sp.]